MLAGHSSNENEITSPVLEAILRIALTEGLPVLEVSGDIEGLLGFKAEDFLSSTVFLKDRIHPDDADVASVLFAPEIQKESVSFNIRMRHADGRIRCIKGDFTKEAGLGGGAMILDLRLQDAKSLRRICEAQETMARLKAMMDNTDDVIYFKDRNHVFTAASQTMVHPGGFAKYWTDLIGKTDYDFLADEFADLYYEMEKQIFAGMPLVQRISAAPSRKGRETWVDNRKYPIKDGSGEIIGLFGIARDITERKKADETLRESEESLKEAQKIAGLGSYVLDVHTGVWSSSDVMNQIFGIDEMYERTVAGWLALVYPDDRVVMDAHFADDVMRKGQRFDKEYRIVRHADRAVRWVHGLGKVEFDAQGMPLKMRGTIQDITGRKLAQEALAKSAERLARAQQVARMGFLDWDLQTGEILLSEETCHMYGIDNTEFRSTPELVAKAVHPDDQERVKRNLELVLQGEQIYDLEHRIVRPDGTILWTHSQAELFLDAEGRPKTLLGTTLDITERKQAEEKLLESKELLRLFIEHAPAALAMFDREMRYLVVSRRWIEEYSLSGQDIIGKCHYEVVPDIPERWKEMHRRGLAGETVYSDEDRFMRADGSVEWNRWEVRPWRTGEGAVGGIILFAEDITLQKQAEERLQLAANVFTHAHEGILITDADGKIVDVNETFSRISGYSREEALGHNPRLLKSGVQGPEFYAEMWRTLKEKGQWSGEVWNRAKSGDIYAELLAISAVRNESGKVHQYVALFSDITAIKEHERQLEHIAHYDVLTGLPNRVLLGDRLSQAMAQSHRRNRKLAVAYLDLDGFKAINDRHGHEAGDLLLSETAHNMKLTLREGDTLSRLGGDEFVAVLLDLDDVETSEPILRRLLDAAAEPVEFGAFSLQVTASVGVAFFPQAEDVDADQLLRQADQAMYQAKLAGKNRYHVFDSKQDRSVRGHHEDLEHIAQALAAREFVLYYQPKVNMRTGVVIGAEALIRWQHPERGLLPPAMFLPVIEDHRLSVDVGDWVIESALTQMERWQAEGLNIPVSVNVSAQQLQQADFVEHLRALLAAHPTIKPSSMELEVLETSALQDLIQISHVINACREIGVLFALDDFGTGYSSLTYLKRLPVSVLKIDQSFVREILEDAESLSILEGVLGLATAFRRQVIAEGVESVEHGLLLLQLGCELAQGYGIARPMPVEKFSGWVAEWRPDPRWERAPAVNQEGRPVLYAGVEHRAWVAAIDAYLKGERHIAPMLDSHACRFCGWLESEEAAGRGWLPELQAIKSIHQKSHALAVALLKRKTQKWDAEGVAGLGELHVLQAVLLQQLEILMQIE
ncbi:MAG: PAS domain S-box protein [Terracidiphilus sp.]|nr:PAS domain S-box protein [Terracidiphilus sp.]